MSGGPPHHSHGTHSRQNPAANASAWNHLQSYLLQVPNFYPRQPPPGMHHHHHLAGAPHHHPATSAGSGGGSSGTVAAASAGSNSSGTSVDLLDSLSAAAAAAAASSLNQQQHGSSGGNTGTSTTAQQQQPPPPPSMLSAASWHVPSANEPMKMSTASQVAAAAHHHLFSLEQMLSADRHYARELMSHQQRNGSSGGGGGMNMSGNGGMNAHHHHQHHQQQPQHHQQHHHHQQQPQQQHNGDLMGALLGAGSGAAGTMPTAPISLSVRDANKINSLLELGGDKSMAALSPGSGGGRKMSNASPGLLSTVNTAALASVNYAATTSATAMQLQQQQYAKSISPGLANDLNSKNCSAASPKSKRSKKGVDSILERLNQPPTTPTPPPVVAATTPELPINCVAPPTATASVPSAPSPAPVVAAPPVSSVPTPQPPQQDDECSNSSAVLLRSSATPTPPATGGGGAASRDEDVVSPFSNDDSGDSNKSRRKRKPCRAVRTSVAAAKDIGAADNATTSPLPTSAATDNAASSNSAVSPVVDDNACELDANKHDVRDDEAKGSGGGSERNAVTSSPATMEGALGAQSLASVGGVCDDVGVEASSSRAIAEGRGGVGNEDALFGGVHDRVDGPMEYSHKVPERRKTPPQPSPGASPSTTSTGATTSTRTRRKRSSESETIAKIAAMVQDMQPTASPTNELPIDTSTPTTSLLENGPATTTTTGAISALLGAEVSSSTPAAKKTSSGSTPFGEVENKLEEMFAGLEESRAASATSAAAVSSALNLNTTGDLLKLDENMDLEDGPVTVPATVDSAPSTSADATALCVADETSPLVAAHKRATRSSAGADGAGLQLMQLNERPRGRKKGPRGGKLGPKAKARAARAKLAAAEASGAVAAVATLDGDGSFAAEVPVLPQRNGGVRRKRKSVGNIAANGPTRRAATSLGTPISATTTSTPTTSTPSTSTANSTDVAASTSFTASTQPPLCRDSTSMTATVPGPSSSSSHPQQQPSCSYDSGSNASNTNIATSASSRSLRGPYIQLRGARDSPHSVCVVNTLGSASASHAGSGTGGGSASNGGSGGSSTVNGEHDGDGAGTGTGRGRHNVKKFHDDSEYRQRVRARGLHSSTLSNKYDSHTRDTTWICVFCKRGPHATAAGGAPSGAGGGGTPSAVAVQSLGDKVALAGGGFVLMEPPGDLFGPYVITSACAEYERRLEDPYDKQFRSKKVCRSLDEAKGVSPCAVSPPGRGRRPGKRKVSESMTNAGDPVTCTTTSPHNLSGPEFYMLGITVMLDDQAPQSLNHRSTTPSSLSTPRKCFEVWTHEECVVWSPGVHLTGSARIVGLEAAIWTSCAVMCSGCGRGGANLCCMRRGCVRVAHVACARSAAWFLFPETYRAYCAEHETFAEKYRKAQQEGNSGKPDHPSISGSSTSAVVASCSKPQGYKEGAATK